MNRRLPYFDACVFALALASATGLALGPPCQAEEPGTNQQAQLLSEMTSLAKQIKVRLVDGDRAAELVAKPVFRFDDQPRRILDATLWMWTAGGRPVAFQKIEAVDRGTPRWSFCCTSFTADLLSVEWPGSQRFESTEAGVTFRLVPGAPAVAARNAERKRQIRDLARKFSSRIVLPDGSSAEMRLLTTPICEFREPKTETLQGAVFGFGTNGTNPDLLLAIEAREEQGRTQWCFAPARITTNGIILTLEEKQVWETPHVNYKEAPFTNWTCFGTPRQPPVLTPESRFPLP